RRFPRPRLARSEPQQLAVAAPVDQQRLDMRLGGAVRGAFVGAHHHELAQVAQRDAALSRYEAQSAPVRLLLHGAHRAGLPARLDRAPLEAHQLSALDRVIQLRLVAALGRFAAHVRAVAIHRRKLFAELELLAHLAAGPDARALVHAVAPGAAQLADRRPAEEDRGDAFLEHRHAELRAALALDEAPRERGEDHVLAGDLAAAVGALARVKDQVGAAAADFADELFRESGTRGEREQHEKYRSHSGVSVGTRLCQSVAC